ncbi:hypothetical protein MPSEU_000788700 [Mayamaea pseudoterrestris]|nr:hypothetical protein MPSEU_000788700 [Mayamaea pseudoterrestris]
MDEANAATGNAMMRAKVFDASRSMKFKYIDNGNVSLRLDVSYLDSVTNHPSVTVTLPPMSVHMTMTNTSPEAEDDRIQRKRHAAKLRQRRCREKKRLMATNKATPMVATAVSRRKSLRTVEAVSSSSSPTTATMDPYDHHHHHQAMYQQQQFHEHEWNLHHHQQPHYIHPNYTMTFLPHPRRLEIPDAARWSSPMLVSDNDDSVIEASIGCSRRSSLSSSNDTESSNTPTSVLDTHEEAAIRAMLSLSSSSSIHSDADSAASDESVQGGGSDATEWTTTNLPCDSPVHETLAL